MFATCWLIYTVHFATNTVREIYPALSLGDHLSFDVSEYLGLHPDIFAVPGRGAFIDNNPGASILGAIPYALARPIIDRVIDQVARNRAAFPPPASYDSPYPMSREFYQQAVERGLDVKFALGAAVMQAFLMAPISALSVVLMFLILLQLTGSTTGAAWLAVLYGLATPVLYRTAQLNHNLLLAHAAFLSFALLWCPWKRAAGSWRFLVAGLLCGWAVVLDYSGIVVVVVLGSYALVQCFAAPRRRGIRELALFGLGVAAGVGVLAVYQWQAFGSPFIPAQRLMPPTALSTYGYNGMGWPQLDLLWDTAFGLRFGLFTSAPLLLLALYPPAWRRTASRLVQHREALCIAAMCVLFFAFAAANQFGRLQFNSGVRYVVPVVPFLFLVVAGVLRVMPRPLAIGLGIAGTYWSWCLAMYRDVEQGLGVFESPLHITLGGPQLPWMTTLERLGYLPSAISPLLVLAVCAVAIWLIWRVRLPQPGLNRM